MILPPVAGALLGLGVFLAFRAAFPPRVTLSVLLDEYDRARAARPQPHLGPSQPGTPLHRLADLAAARGWPGPRLRADLDLLGVSVEQYAARLASAAAAGLAAGVAVSVVAARVSTLLAGWLLVITAGGVPAAVQRGVHLTAAARRRDMRAALTGYLNLVALRLSSGAGIAEALHDAARVGQGPLFRRLRGSLTDARIHGRSHADTLAALGTAVGVDDLRDLAATVGLVEAGGAQAAVTLRAKATSLRDRQLAELHGQASERTQTMTVAQALLAFGYLLFLGYPSLTVVGHPV